MLASRSLLLQDLQLVRLQVSRVVRDGLPQAPAFAAKGLDQDLHGGCPAWPERIVICRAEIRATTAPPGHSLAKNVGRAAARLEMRVPAVTYSGS